MPFDLSRYAASRARDLLLPGLPGVSKRRGTTTTNLNRTGPIEVVAAPSVKVRPLVAGVVTSGVVVELTFRTKYADGLGDLNFLHGVARAMIERFKQMSRGPLKTKQLRLMGNPYGRDKGGIGRRVPRGAFGRSLAHPKGVRGSVPTLSVVNRQSGNFERAWRYNIIRTSFGALLRFINETVPAYLLAAGTRRMQAHGPFSFVPTHFRSQLMSAWQKEVNQARMAASNAALAAQSLGI